MSIRIFFKTTLDKIIRHKDFKNLISNFSYISLLQVANFIFPLFTIPYLIRVLGIEKFGLIAFSVSIITFFTMVVEFGFGVSATRDIAVNLNNQKKINAIFSTVLLIKFLLAIFSFLIYIIIIFTFNKFSGNINFYLLSFLTVFGQFLIPFWYFQGIEQMKFISVFYFIAKLIYTFLIFLFIKESGDYLFVPLVEFVSFGIISIVSLIIVFSKFKIQLVLPKFKQVKKTFQESYYLFISNISVILYTSSITTILGFLTNNQIVGFYSVAEKIIFAIRGLMGPISQVLYPYLVKVSKESKLKVLNINSTLIRYGSIPFILLGVFVFLFSEQIIFLITGKNDTESINVLKIFSFLPFIFFTHTVLALFTMLVFNKNKDYSKITLSAGIINIFVCTISIYLFQHIGAAISVLFIEIYVGYRYLIYTRKNFLKII